MGDEVKTLDFDRANVEVRRVLAECGFEKLSDVIGFLEVLKQDIYLKVAMAHMNNASEGS